LAWVLLGYAKVNSVRIRQRLIRFKSPFPEPLAALRRVGAPWLVPQE